MVRKWTRIDLSNVEMPPPSTPTDTSPFAADQVIAHYKLIKRLGRGGFGEVWEATDQRFGRGVAIKFLLPKYSDDKKAVKRFKSEAVLASRFSHASIVQMLDTGLTKGGAHYHVMELVDGKLLWDLLKEADAAKTTLGLPLAGYIGWQIAFVLAALHERDIIHRDLKPQNLMLVPDQMIPGGKRVKLLDFGIAKLDNEAEAAALDLGAETTTGAHMGSPIVMANEQWRTGESITTQVDCYALGCILYKMFSGTYPFEGSVNELRIHHQLIDPTPLRAENSAISAEWSDLVQRMLAKSPAARPTMAETRDVIGRLMGLSVAAAAPVVIRPTREIDVMLAELSTGPTGSIAMGQTPTQPLSTVARPGTDKAADVQAAAQTSAKNGQQVPSAETLAKRRRSRWAIPAGLGAVALLSAGVFGAKILGHSEKVPAVQPAPIAKPIVQTSQVPTPTSAASKPATAPDPTPAVTPPVTPPEPSAGKSRCVAVEPTDACISGKLSSSDREAVITALTEANVKLCPGDFLTFVGRPSLEITAAKGVRPNKRDHLLLALRGALSTTSFPGEVVIQCAKAR